MAPDGLEQVFRRRVIFITQDVPRVEARAPVGIKIIVRRRHCGLLLRLGLSKVKPARDFDRSQRRFWRFKTRFCLVAEFLLAGTPDFLLDSARRFNGRQCDD